MKVEFLHHYKARHGYTLKDKLLAHLPDYANWASRLAPLLNLRDKAPGLAALSEKMLGLSAKRTLPLWKTQTFFNSNPVSATREEVLAASKSVVVFVDTFNGYFEADNASSALKILQAAGYTAHVATKTIAGGKRLCCGRTFLASGMVDKAKAMARELVESRCCGMAGSFGYAASHYAVSMQMAELSLLPAVRQQLDAIVVADGTSCRHQIRDGAQREAIHVAVLLARQL